MIFMTILDTVHYQVLHAKPYRGRQPSLISNAIQFRKNNNIGAINLIPQKRGELHCKSDSVAVRISFRGTKLN